MMNENEQEKEKINIQPENKDEKSEEKEKIVQQEEQDEKEKQLEAQSEKTLNNNIEETVQKENSHEQNEVKTDKGKNKNKKKGIFWLLFVTILLILGLLFSTIFALININNTKIMEGVLIKNIDVSNLTKDEAKQKLAEVIKLELEKTVELKYKEFQVTIAAEQIEANYDLDTAVDMAYSIGRSGNIIVNNYNILYALIKNTNIEPKFVYNEQKLDEFIADTSKKLPDSVVEGAYYIEDDYLIITKGHYGTIIKKDKAKEEILNAMQGIGEKIIEIEVEYKEPDKLNIDEIYSEVYTEPKDAYYETNPFKIYPHVNGIDFAITLEEARALLETEQEEYKIPLKYIEPNVTTSKIGTEAFPDLLSSYTTKYDASERNRSTNMEIAAQKINGLVLMPGEVFSYNKVVGKRTPEAGFKPAGVYEGGKVVTGYGGGICQVSSTLYNVALLANLEIVERQNHQFLTSYVSAGRDATVNYGTIDFEFRNSRKYPVKIICNVSNGICEVKLYGAKEEIEYVVKIESKVTASIPYTTKYEEDANMEIGQEKIVQYGANGCRSIAYKILILNGSVVSQEVLSEDTYSAMTKIVRRGTKGPAVVKTEPIEEQNEQTEQVEQSEGNNAQTENTQIENN